MNISEILRDTQARYASEYLIKEPQVVTTVMDKVGDDCDGRNMKTVMRRYRMTTKETMIRDGYNEHNKQTYRTYTKTIPPRKFYTEEQVYTYARYVNRIAGRTLETDEMNLLLKTIARGRQYELVCVSDVTEELRGVTKWER